MTCVSSSGAVSIALIAARVVTGEANGPARLALTRNCPMFRLARFAAIAVVLITLRIHAAEPQLISVTKIWDHGKHNAFTDLIRWHDRFYCAFREADAHVGGDGQLRVLESADGEKWQSAALIGEAGIDLRDPKLSITPDDSLM